MVSKKSVGRPRRNAAVATPTPPKRQLPRRVSRVDVELMMECMDDELSPAQLKAIDDAQKEHEKVVFL